MSNFTDFGESLMCGIIKGTSPSLPAQFHVGLLTAVSDASYTEVSWSGYERKAIDRTMIAWAGTQGAGTTVASNGTSHTTSNNVEVNFGAAGDTTSIVAVGLFAGSDMLAYSNMGTALQVESGDPIVLSPGSLVFTLGISGGMTDYLSNKMIDWIWRGQSYTFPATMYLALNTGLANNAGRGTEVTGLGYFRVSQNSSSWGNPSNGTISNSAALVFSTPQSNWGNIVGCSFFDSATGGNMLLWAQVAVAKTIVNGGAAPRFDAGAITIQVL